MAFPSAIQPIGSSAKLCWQLYSDPGAGKTVLAATGGPKTLIVHSPLDHCDAVLKRIPLAQRPSEWIVRDWDDMNNVRDYMRQEGYREWDIMWLDSVSLWQMTGLDDIWQSVIDAKPHRYQYGADKPEYGTNMFRLGGWIRSMVMTPGFHFGVTAHPFETDTLDGHLKLAPYVQGKNMAPMVSGCMNLVSYMEVKRHLKTGQRYRVLHSQASDQFYAKDQFDAFGEDGTMVNPTFAKVMDAIVKARGKPFPIDNPTRRTTRRSAPTSAPTRTRRRTRREQ